MSNNQLQIPQYVTDVIKRLESGGYECYIVGGAVRDHLMGAIPQDYDIATSATPQQVKDTLTTSFNVIETGLKHGTCTVISGGEPVEVTTFRIDGEYTDNRRPEQVFFSGSVEDDLSRRDFTINAIAYHPRKGFCDYFGGTYDVKSGIIRCVGEPDRRFNEDGLRILRALRMAATLGFCIEKSTANSIRRNKALLKNISSERVFAELSKLIVGRNAGAVLGEYSDVIAVFIPEFVGCIGFAQNTKYHCYDVGEHIIKAVDFAPRELRLRLAAFFHDIGKPQSYTEDSDGTGHFYGHADVSEEICKTVLRRLKAPNKLAEYVAELVRRHGAEIIPQEKYVKRFLAKTSVPFLKDLIKLKRADALAHAQEYCDNEEYFQKITKTIEKIEREESCISLKTLEINGNDLITLGHKGEEIGQILQEVLELVIDGELPNQKEILIKHIECRG